MLRLRFMFLVLAAIALPGTCISEALPPRDYTAPLLMKSLPDPPGADLEIVPGLTWIKGWELSSDNYHFDGYSALVARPDGSLFALSDRSHLLIFNPESPRSEQTRFDWLHDVESIDADTVDLEAVHEDEESGTFWTAFERENLLMRFNAQERLTGWSRPEAMRGWTNNGGPEAMTRLPDGRFLVLSEVPRSWFSDVHEAVIFEGDPVEGAHAKEFEFRLPDAFRAVDVAVLPSGQLAILLRKPRFGIPPGFASAMLLGEIDEGGSKPTLRAHDFIDLMGHIPPENYEGMAVRPLSDGSAELWLISDNNRSVFQHTYLIKLHWSPNEKTRGKPARVSEKSNGSKAAEN